MHCSRGNTTAGHRRALIMEQLHEFQCARCRATKKSKLVVVKGRRLVEVAVQQVLREHSVEAQISGNRGWGSAAPDSNATVLPSFRSVCEGRVNWASPAAPCQSTLPSSQTIRTRPRPIRISAAVRVTAWPAAESQ
jgi:hypothetical protein